MFLFVVAYIKWLSETTIIFQTEFNPEDKIVNNKQTKKQTQKLVLIKSTSFYRILLCLCFVSHLPSLQVLVRSTCLILIEQSQVFVEAQ